MMILTMAKLTNLSLLVFVLCVLISLNSRNSQIKKGSSPSSFTTTWSSTWDSDPSIFLAPSSSTHSTHFSRAHKPSQEQEDNFDRSLEYDFYRDSCPQAEKIIRDVVHDLHKVRSDVAPALLRLVFHDCFIEGCDASLLLDPTEGVESEKDSPPNEGLRGFDIIDIIKSELEQVCPGVVSCADIVALAARDGVVKAGGPFYPLYTGRRDGIQSFKDTATDDLPSPQADLSETLAAFASKGFDERETVSLLGSHSIGTIRCKFFQNRLYNFGGTNKPDPSLDTEFLKLMRSRCNNGSSTSMTAPASSPLHSMSKSSGPSSAFNGSESPSGAQSPYYSGSISSLSDDPKNKNSLSSSAGPSSSFRGSTSSSLSPPASFADSLLFSSEEQRMKMGYEGAGADFGTVYYRRLLQGRGILYADQQLMAGVETGLWVRAYASYAFLFRRDFALAMMKLSNLRVLTGSTGQVRLNCSKVA